jgi:MFS family permease
LAYGSTQSRNLVGYKDLILKNHNFRYLWFGQIVSLLGDWFNLIASASLIANLTKSGLAVGGLFVVRMLAPFLISPIAGVFADRYNRKKLLILCDILRAIVVSGFLLVREPGQVWLLYTLTAIQLAISGFFYPARSAILPEVVSKNELGAANALGSSTWSIMLSLGAAFGGLVAGQWGIYPSFVIDALSFLISAILITQIHYEQLFQQKETSATIIGAFKEYVDGIRYLLENRGILIISLLKAANSLTTGSFQVIQVYLAEQFYVIGTGGSISLGLIYAVVGAGTGVAPILARKFTADRDRPMRIAIIVGWAITVVGLVLTAPIPAFWLLLLGVLVRGLGGGINWVFSTQILLQSVPNRVQGRVFSTEFAAMTLAGAVAAYLGGWGMDQPAIGISEIIWAMAISSLAIGALWTFYFIVRDKKNQQEIRQTTST